MQNRFKKQQRNFVFSQAYNFSEICTVCTGTYLNLNSENYMSEIGMYLGVCRYIIYNNMYYLSNTYSFYFWEVCG